MIINSLPYSCADKDQFQIRSFNRAPLGLAHRSKALIVQTLYKKKTTQHDFVISPYQFSDWGDLWHLEIHVYDHEGQLQRLISIFDKLKIKVLSSESRITFDERSSAKHFMLDCKNYVSDIDRDTKYRIKNPQSLLQGLRDYIFLKFVTEIRYSGGVEPRIKIERNWPHFGLYQRIKDEDENIDHATLIGPEIITLKRQGWFDIPKKFLKSRENENGYAPDSTNRIYVSTNVRSKILYISSYRKTNINHVSLALYFLGKDGILEKIYRVPGLK